MGIIALGAIGNPAKKQYGDAAVMSIRVPQAIELIKVDPDISGATAILFGSDVLRGAEGGLLRAALAQRHPSCVAIFMYKSDKELEAVDLSAIPNLYIRLVKKLVFGEEFGHAVDSAIDDAITRGQTALPDSTRPVESTIGATPETMLAPGAVLTEDGTSGIVDDITAAVADELGDLPDLPPPPETPLQGGSEPPPIPQPSELLERVRACANRLDISALDAMLAQGSLTHSLLSENINYQSAAQTIASIDAEISLISADNKRSPSDRLSAIKTLVLKRAAFVDTCNAETVNLYINIIDTIVSTAQAAVQMELDRTRATFAGTTVMDLFTAEISVLTALVTKRLESKVKVSSIFADLQHTFVMLDKNKDMIITEMLHRPITGSPVLNETLAPIADEFRPMHTGELIDQIVGAINSGRITFSAIAESVKALIAELFTLFDYDESVIGQEEYLRRFLSAQNINEVVVPENLLQFKSTMLIAARGYGRTATALSIASAWSRVDNTLLLDMSWPNTTTRYVEKPYGVSEFAELQTRSKLTIVARDSEHINYATLASALNNTVNFFSKILIVCSADDLVTQKEFLPIVSRVNFVVNGYAQSIEAVSAVTKDFDVPNKAVTLTLLNCGIHTATVLNRLGLAMDKTKVISVPFLQDIQVAAMVRRNPGEYDSVSTVFIEAFV